MDLIPLNNDTNETQTKNNPKIENANYKRLFTKDPLSVIPNDMYQIITSYRSTLFLNIILQMLSLIILASLITVFAIFLKSHSWFLYIWPTLLFVFISYKLTIQFMKYSAFNKSVNRYREDVRYELTSNPQFLDNIYTSLIKKTNCS